MNNRYFHRQTFAILTLMLVSACTAKTAAVAENAAPPVTQTKVTEPILPQVHQDKLEACYENFLKTKPQKDEGSLLVSWDLNQKGEISTTKIVESDLKDKRFTSCVIENLKKAQFPQVAAYPKTVAHKYNFKRRAPASL